MVAPTDWTSLVLLALMTGLPLILLPLLTELPLILLPLLTGVWTPLDNVAPNGSEPPRD